MKRILVVGASILQLPAVLQAKELGYEVAVADYNPKAIAIPYADKFYCVSTIDEKGVCQAARDFQVDGVMTLATDMPMRAVAYTCEQLGLNGISYASAVKATDKGEMIRAFEKEGVPHPGYRVVGVDEELTSLPEGFTYPIISKPTDSSGSHGVKLIRNEKEFRETLAFSKESGRSGNVIIEDYMVGPEISVETLTLGEECHVIQITDKLTTGAPHFVEMGHSQPTRLSPETVEKVRQVAKAANKALGITKGPSHTEMIITKDGPKIVEVGARLGGDCITTHLVPLSCGVNMVEACLKIALGEPVELPKDLKKGSAIRYIPQHAGKVISVEGIEETKKLPGVHQVSIVHGVGEELTDVVDSGSRMGFVIAQAENAEEAVKICERALSLIKVEIENV